MRLDRCWKLEPLLMVADVHGGVAKPSIASHSLVFRAEDCEAGSIIVNIAIFFINNFMEQKKVESVIDRSECACICC